MILSDYECGACGAIFESLEPRPAPSSVACACGGEAKRILSAVAIGTVWGSVTRGVSDAPPPGAMDTRSLADGQSYSEWRKERRKGRADEVREGLIDRKVYVHR